MKGCKWIEGFTKPCGKPFARPEGRDHGPYCTKHRRVYLALGALEQERLAEARRMLGALKRERG